MFDAYKVAVKVSLVNHVSAGILGISQQFKSGAADVAAYQKHLDKIGLTVLKGGAMMATGAFGLGMFAKTLKPAEEYAKQLSLMNTLGMKHAEVMGVINKSWETSREVTTSTVWENMATFRELRSAFGAGHESSAQAMLPTVQRVQGILTALTGREQEHVGFDMVKAIELRSGVMSEAALQRNSDLMTRSLIAMGGTINVNDFHQALKYGKMATMKWTDEFTYSLLPTLMQEMKAGRGGASSAGQGLFSLYQQVHGTMTKAAYENWIAGKLVAPQDVVKNATGHWQMKPGAVKDLALFEENPYAWVQKDLAPAVSRIVAMKHVTEETAINSLFSNRNAAFTAYTFYKKAQQFERDKTLIEQASSGKDAYDKLMKDNPMLAQMALQKKWQELLGVLGFTVMPELIKGFTWLSEHLRSMSDWFRENQGTAKALMYGLGGLSAALLFGGTVTVLSAAFLGLRLALGAGVAGSAGLAVSLGAVATGLVAIAAAAAVFYVGYKAWDAWTHPEDHPLVNIIKNGTNNAKRHQQMPGGFTPIGAAVPGYSDGTEAPHIGRMTLGEFNTIAPTKSGGNRMINNTIVMPDGRVLANVVTQEQSKSLNRPSAGQSTFDGSMSPRPLAMGGR